MDMMDMIIASTAACETPPQYQPTGRTVFETILWIAIICAYIPQYLCIRRHGTLGVSPYYVLNHSLFSTTTLALRLSHSIFYPAFNCIAEGKLRDWKGYSASLGFVGVLVQWLCSVVLLLVYIRYRTTKPPPEEIQLRILHDFHAHKLTSRRMIVVLSAYAAGTIPMSLALLCFNTHPYFHNEHHRTAFYVVFWSVWIAFLCAADAFLVVFQFIKQMKTVGRLRTRGSISIASVAMQSIVLIMLAVTQFYRSRRNIVIRKEPHMSLGHFLQLLAFAYGCFSVDVMYIVAALGYLVLFQLSLLFDWNDMFGARFGRIQLL